MDFSVFETYKIAKVRDRRLGLGYALGTIAAVGAYVMFVFYGKLYFEYDYSPPGDVFARLGPRGTHSENHTYCLREGWSCEAWDEWELAQLSDRSISVVTAMIEDEQRRVCARSDIACASEKIWKRTRRRFMLPLAPEDFTLKLEHSIGPSRFGDKFAASNKMVPGYWEAPKGLHEQSDMFPLEEYQDEIILKDLIARAGASLDDPSDFSLVIGNETSPFRHSGIILHLNIHYTTTHPDHFGELVYIYRVSRAKGARFRTITTTTKDSEDDEEVRIMRRKFSIKVAFSISGELGEVTLASVVPHASFVLTIYTIIYNVVTLFAINSHENLIYGRASKED